MMDEKSAHSTGEGPSDQYRLIEHTADLGFEVEAPDLEALFARAALALHDIMADTQAARPAEERRIEAEGGDLEELFLRFLEEAHYAFEGERFIFASVAVEPVLVPASDPGRARAVARGERFDPARHELRRPVKAVTWHDLAVARTPAGFRARVIVDL
jgi:SHS2 domain-containing protein